MKRDVIVFILLICAFLAIGCTGQQPTAQANETPATPANSTTDGKVIEVSIQNFAFEPNSVKLSIGDTVKWPHLDSVPHTIKGADFISQSLNKDDSFSYTFTKTGTYDYECSIHPSMKGVVIVE
ncbi:plastocyanin/azurin family copper-binding protein [uncultured Methanomethylovorans sp.]|uniref:plastocyanin/azurin family copper-binding protein n=1 Tax=uncultured Methanomethylovorans sp. TaxID=183759 RepID=UPI002AA70851|nr:plastocyanin/azurin family copper-binding protein [uncultured Methanomethylovorans sp.]